MAMWDFADSSPGLRLASSWTSQQSIKPTPPIHSSACPEGSVASTVGQMKCCNFRKGIALPSLGPVCMLTAWFHGMHVCCWCWRSIELNAKPLSDVLIVVMCVFALKLEQSHVERSATVQGQAWITTELVLRCAPDQPDSPKTLKASARDCRIGRQGPPCPRTSSMQHNIPFRKGQCPSLHAMDGHHFDWGSHENPRKCRQCNFAQRSRWYVGLTREEGAMFPWPTKAQQVAWRGCSMARQPWLTNHSG